MGGGGGFVICTNDGMVVRFPRVGNRGLCLHAIVTSGPEK